MRSVIVGLLILLGIAPVIYSQDEGFPRCSSAELAFVLEQQGEFDALMEMALADEDAANFILAYGAAQIEWRERLWANLPPCAEAIGAAALLSESTSDIASMAALTYAGVPMSANPYLRYEANAGEAHERVASYFDEISAVIDSGERPAEPAPGERSLVSCEVAEFEALLDVLKASEDLMVSGTNAFAPDALAEYVSEMLSWRDGLWGQLMPCQQAVALGKLMSQTAGDIVTGYALVFSGVPAAENPYSELLEEQLIELGKYMESLLVVISVEKTAKSLEQEPPELPACSASDMRTVAPKLAALSDIAADASVDKSVDGLLDYIGTMIARREALWTDAPLCAEVLEVSLAASYAANDFATAFALAYAGQGLNHTPYIRMSIDGFNEVRRWREKQAKDADGSQVPEQADYLPQCTDADHRSLQVNATLISVFWSMLGEIESRDDLLSFGEKQVDLREDIWTQLPLCQEAVEGGRLVLQLTGDIVPTLALVMFAGVPAEEIPYLSAISGAAEQVEAFAAASDGG